MKNLIVIILAMSFTAYSFPSNAETGTIVKMPKGYTIQQTKEFSQKLVTPDLIKKIHSKFPNISEQKKGRFDFYPVVLPDQNGKLSDSGIIVKITGLEGWDRKGEFKQFLVSYLRAEIKKLPEGDGGTSQHSTLTTNPPPRGAAGSGGSEESDD